METTILGTLESAETMDLRKAYLRALAEVPTLDMNSTQTVRGAKKKFKDAHPGSVYLIKTNVPTTNINFPPLAFRNPFGEVGYPTGEFISYQSKPALEVLEIDGSVQYEIIDSLQFIVLNSNGRPFKEMCDSIEFFEEFKKEDLYPLNLKGLHQSLAGSMQHYHRNVDVSTGKTTFGTSSDFNPILANAIQGTVAKTIWEQAVTNNTTAIRVDALTGKKLPHSEEFKNEGPGTSTFLTPYLKDQPGKTFYRDLIYENRDISTINLAFPVRVSLKQGYLHPLSIGKLLSVDIKIPASSGSRLMDQSKIKRLGHLLDSEVHTFVPTIEQLCIGGAKPWERKDTPEWLLYYLETYQKSQT
jgi:hypothetical protein